MPPKKDDSPLETWEKLPALAARISRIIVCGLFLVIAVVCMAGGEKTAGACFVIWAALLILLDAAADIKMRLEAILEELRRQK